MEIVQQYSANDRQELFNKWYREFRPMVYKLVVEKTKDASIVEDIFHDSLMLVYEKMVGNELHLTAKLSTYLYGIASNKCMEHIRQKKKENKVSFDDEFEEIEETTYDLSKEERAKLLAICLKKLSEVKVNILVAFYKHQYSMDRIAEMFGLGNSDSAKSQKCKVINELKICRNKHKAA